MKKSTIKRIKITTIILFAIGLLFTHFYIPRFITEIRNPLVDLIRGNNPDLKARTFNHTADQGREIRFNAFDDETLVAHEIYSKSDTTIGTIILLHGIRSRKEHFMGLSIRLAKEGFNVITLDLRAHGESGGTNCSFGVFEKRDIASLLDILTAEKRNHKVGIFGQSLGGAIALQALGSDDRLSYGVIESTFSDFRTITHDYIRYHLGFSVKLFSNYLVNRAGSIANFDPNQASPITYCKMISQPVLMVHGSDDRRINIKYGRANYNALENSKSDFIEVAGANHINVWKIGGEEYMDKVICFIKIQSQL